MDPLARFLAAWDALCGPAPADGSVAALSSADALVAGTPAQREAVAVALEALGYADAWGHVYRLGAALRRIRGRLATDGRALRRIPARVNRWYVRAASVAAEQEAA